MFANWCPARRKEVASTASVQRSLHLVQNLGQKPHSLSSPACGWQHPFAPCWLPSSSRAGRLSFGCISIFLRAANSNASRCKHAQGQLLILNLHSQISSQTTGPLRAAAGEGSFYKILKTASYCAAFKGHFELCNYHISSIPIDLTTMVLPQLLPGPSRCP